MLPQSKFRIFSSRSSNFCLQLGEDTAIISLLSEWKLNRLSYYPDRTQPCKRQTPYYRLADFMQTPQSTTHYEKHWCMVYMYSIKRRAGPLFLMIYLFKKLYPLIYLIKRAFFPSHNLPRQPNFHIYQLFHFLPYQLSTLPRWQFMIKYMLWSHVAFVLICTFEWCAHFLRINQKVYFKVDE